MTFWSSFHINIVRMNKEHINNRRFEVSILNKGKDGETLCYKVSNDQLGEFVISNCHYNTDPSYFKKALFHLNGNASIYTEDDGECNFIAILTIHYIDSKKGVVFLRC